MLVILASGFRADCYGAARIWPVDTPDLDTLMHDGLATVAVASSPDAHTALLSQYTGRHARQMGRLGRKHRAGKVGGWVAALRDAGYYCAGVGRVKPIDDHLDASLVVAGPDELDERACEYLRFADHVGLGEQVRRQRMTRLRRGPFIDERGPAEPMHDVDGYIANQAEQMIVRLPKDRPWVMIVALTGPGNDLPAPGAMLEQVGREGLGEDFVPISPNNMDDHIVCDFPRTFLQNITLAKTKQLRTHYLARVLLLDGMVGRLRESLDEAGHSESTWIALAGDRGKLLGELGLFGGWSMLSPAVYTPLWLMPPENVKIKAGDNENTNDGLVSTIDLAATLCEIGGVDPPAGCVGRSILPGLVGQPIGHDSVICEFENRMMLETLRHRVVFDTETASPRLLFDLSTDPRERENLVDQPHRANILDSLRMRLAGALMSLKPV